MNTEPYMALRTSAVAKTNSYTIKFDRSISSPHMWQEEIDTIRQTKLGDDVTIYVNTTGGSAYTLKEVIHAIESSEATFHGVLAGSAYSAGGPIFLACDTFEVGELADMMCHTIQSGYEGSSNAIHKFGEHINTEARILIEKCYEGFLTQEEMEAILIGDDIWLQAEDIVNRLELRQQYFLDKEPKISVDGHVKLLQEDLVEYSKDNNISHEDLVKCLLLAMTTEASITNLTEHLHETTEDVTSGPVESKPLHISGGLCLGRNYEIILNGVVYRSVQEALNSDSTLKLHGLANLLVVPFAHNIGYLKLLRRVEDKIKVIVDKHFDK